MNSYVKNHQRKSLAEHVLRKVSDGKVTAYYMEQPGKGRMMSTLLVFTPEGIAIMGDLTPETNGTVSAFGYAVDWFAGKNSEDYLCEKFLHREWVPELAEAALRDPQGWVREARPAETLAAIDDLADQLSHECLPETDLYHELDSLGILCDDGIPGYGYAPAKAGWLCAIQQRFAELYAEAARKGGGS